MHLHETRLDAATRHPAGVSDRQNIRWSGYPYVKRHLPATCGRAITKLEETATSRRNNWPLPLNNNLESTHTRFHISHCFS